MSAVAAGMQVIETVSAMREACRAVRKQGTLGLVPTMGALHEGHLSLVRRAHAECGAVAATIFVNPTQFAPGEDFDRYPRPMERDRALLEGEGVDLLFTPSVAEMYPAGATTFVDAGELGERLDGAHRPGHFRGVATVVSKLLHIAEPERMYLGLKDAAQAAVLRRMVRDLLLPVEIVGCETVRERDGLAMSSRNAYLSPGERARAVALPRALDAVRAAVLAGTREPQAALAAGHEGLRGIEGVELEYLQAVDASTLQLVTEITPGTLVAVAARVGRTRLIDNFLAP